jgi:hypothetical protein
MPINHLSVLLAESQALPFQAGAMEQLNLRKLAALLRHATSGVPQ